MDEAGFLGPFRRLPNYRDQLLLQTLMDAPTNHLVGQLGDVCCIDFDVRPQRTYLSLAKGKAQKSMDGIDWDAVLDRCILSVVRTLLTCTRQVEYGIEGECDDGTVTCWARVKNPTKQTVRFLRRQFITRLTNQKWPLDHPDRVQLLLSNDPINPTPGRDRISIRVTDPKTHTVVQMLAENFYLVNQGEAHLTSYPLAAWGVLADQLKE